MNITKDIVYIGVNDHDVDLFEGQYVVPNGMSYNSYVIIDEKIAVLDTVDAHFTHEWLDNLQNALDGRRPDYLIVQHMEPDHSANIANFAAAYPEARIVANQKTFAMIENFFENLDIESRKVVVKNGDKVRTVLSVRAIADMRLVKRWYYQKYQQKDGDVFVICSDEEAVWEAMRVCQKSEPKKI